VAKSRAVTRASVYRWYMKMLRRNIVTAVPNGSHITDDIIRLAMKATEEELSNFVQGFSAYSLIRTQVDSVLQKYNVPPIQRIYFYAYAEKMYKHLILKRETAVDEVYSSLRAMFIRMYESKVYPFNDTQLVLNILNDIDANVLKLSAQTTAQAGGAE
jgi:hypothetical protein